MVSNPPPSLGGPAWVFLKESIGKWDGFHAELLKRPIRWEDGYIIPPTEAGIGVELDEEVAARNAYREGESAWWRN